MSSGFGEQSFDQGEPAAAVPGWYPSPDGQQRYWDGTSWSEAASAPASAGFGGEMQGYNTGVATSDDKTMAMIAHGGAIFTSFVAPLIIWIMKKDESEFVKHHATESLNFQITMAIAWTISFVLAFVLIGFLLMPVLFILQLLFPILALMKANNGEAYRYPISIRMIS